MNSIPPSSSSTPFPSTLPADIQSRPTENSAPQGTAQNIKSSRSLANLRGAGNVVRKKLFSSIGRSNAAEQPFAGNYKSLEELRTSQVNPYISKTYIDTVSTALDSAKSAKIFPSELRELAVRIQVNLGAGILPLVRVISQSSLPLNDQVAVLASRLENECRQLSISRPPVRTFPGGLPDRSAELTTESAIDAASTREQMMHLLTLQATHAALIGEIDKIRTTMQSATDANTVKASSRAKNLTSQIAKNKDQLKALVALAEELGSTYFRLYKNAEQQSNQLVLQSVPYANLLPIGDETPTFYKQALAQAIAKPRPADVFGEFNELASRIRLNTNFGLLPLINEKKSSNPDLNTASLVEDLIDVIEQNRLHRKILTDTIPLASGQGNASTSALQNSEEVRLFIKVKMLKVLELLAANKPLIDYINRILDAEDIAESGVMRGPIAADSREVRRSIDVSKSDLQTLVALLENIGSEIFESALGNVLTSTLKEVNERPSDNYSPRAFLKEQEQDRKRLLKALRQMDPTLSPDISLSPASVTRNLGTNAIQPSPGTLRSPAVQSLFSALAELGFVMPSEGATTNTKSFVTVKTMLDDRSIGPVLRKVFQAVADKQETSVPKSRDEAVKSLFVALSTMPLIAVQLAQLLNLELSGDEAIANRFRISYVFQALKQLGFEPVQGDAKNASAVVASERRQIGDDMQRLFNTIEPTEDGMNNLVRTLNGNPKLATEIAGLQNWKWINDNSPEAQRFQTLARLDRVDLGTNGPRADRESPPPTEEAIRNALGTMVSPVDLPSGKRINRNR